MLLFSLDLYTGKGTDLRASVEARSPHLAAVARRLERVFTIKSPLAPGFSCVGAELVTDAGPMGERVSATGNGETLEHALLSCLGEASDLLSQFERPGDVHVRGRSHKFPDAVVDGWIDQLLQGDERDLDWMCGRNGVSGAAALLPADLCLRRNANRRAIEPAGAISSGVAAGQDIDAAATRAVLELCERDAAALWWLGGRPARRFSLEHPGYEAACGLMAQLRAGVEQRRTSLLDISAELGVPVVAAISTSADGHGLACGLAARLDWSEAMNAAILEMCQMEMAAPVAEMKRQESGDSALNAIDRRHLRRAAFDTSTCELLHPRGVALESARRPDRTLSALTEGLHEKGIRVFLIDLTRADIGVPVVRAISPDLQPFALTVGGARLQSQIANFGSRLSTAEIPLI